MAAQPRTTSEAAGTSRPRNAGEALEAARALDRARYIGRGRWYRERIRDANVRYYRALGCLALGLSAAAVGVCVVSWNGPDLLGWLIDHYELAFKWLCGSVFLVALVGQILVQTRVAFLRKAAREEGIQIDTSSRYL